MDSEAVVSGLWNSRPMAVRQKTTRKKSKASSVQPKVPARNAGVRSVSVRTAAVAAVLTASSFRDGGRSQVFHQKRVDLGAGIARESGVDAIEMMAARRGVIDLVLKLAPGRPQRVHQVLHFGDMHGLIGRVAVNQ